MNATIEKAGKTLARLKHAETRIGQEYNFWSKNPYGAFENFPTPGRSVSSEANLRLDEFHDNKLDLVVKLEDHILAKAGDVHRAAIKSIARNIRKKSK